MVIDKDGYAHQTSPDESVAAAVHNARHDADRCPGCDWAWMQSPIGFDTGCCDACRGRGPVLQGNSKVSQW